MYPITTQKMQMIIEAALMVAQQPLNPNALQRLFSEEEKPSVAYIKEILDTIKAKYSESGIELKEVASGFRFQTKSELSPWLSKLWEERAPRYSRAFLETLAIIAYRQPITRAEIEEIRGVTVSSQIMRTLTERTFVKIIGYREVPGKPAIYATTKTFLDYFNLKSLSELPSLQAFKDLALKEEEIAVQLEIDSIVSIPESENIPDENNSYDDIEIDNNENIPKENSG